MTRFGWFLALCAVLHSGLAFHANSAYSRSFQLLAKKKGAGGKAKGNLKRALGASESKKSSAPANVWSRISGVSLPGRDGELKAWELAVDGESKVLCCCRHEGRIFVLDSACTKCAWDIYKGDILPGDAENEARVACPLCGQTYSLSTGQPLEQIERKGLAGLVGGLAKQATVTNQATRLRAYPLRVQTSEHDPKKQLVDLDLR